MSRNYSHGDSNSNDENNFNNNNDNNSNNNNNDKNNNNNNNNNNFNDNNYHSLYYQAKKGPQGICCIHIPWTTRYMHAFFILSFNYPNFNCCLRALT